MVKIIILLFLLWRLFLFLPLLASHTLLSPRAGYNYTLLTHFLDKSQAILSHFLLYPFANFDGVYYLLIAANGYTANTGFFPLFPLSIHLITSLFGEIPAFDLIQYIVSIALVTIYFLASLFLFYRLLQLDYSKNISLLSILFLLLFPTSFFYASIYSESLFLFLSLLTFYFARKKKWLLASIFGALLSATRIVGIAILPALLYEYIKEERDKSKLKMASFLLVPLGLLSYMIFNFLTFKNPFHFIAAQGNFMNNRSIDSIVLLPQTIFRYLKILGTVSPSIYEWWIAFLELSLCVFVITLLIVAWKKKVRFSYLIFGALCFLIPASSGTFTGLPRYVLVIFPLFITLALIQRTYLKILYGIISLIFLFLFFLLFSKGYYIA